MVNSVHNSISIFLQCVQSVLDVVVDCLLNLPTQFINLVLTARVLHNGVQDGCASYDTVMMRSMLYKVCVPHPSLHCLRVVVNQKIKLKTVKWNKTEAASTTVANLHVLRLGGKYFGLTCILQHCYCGKMKRQSKTKWNGSCTHNNLSGSSPWHGWAEVHAVMDTQFFWSTWMLKTFAKWLVQTSKQASKYTHAHNAVILVWGLLRFAPIKWGVSLASRWTLILLNYYT